VELGDVITKASLADAFRLALRELEIRLVQPTVR
jgi:rsbT co-antagonist protein RsbR